MDIFIEIIIACWVVFIGYWGISALNTKRYAPGGFNRRGWVARIVFVVIIVAALQIPAVRSLAARSDMLVGDVPLQALGMALVILGVGLAVWARAYLGRNWGMPMTLKLNPELVTTGPYAYIRNPIYTGVILATLGSALAVNLFWFVATLFFGAYFIWSAKVEEKIMREQFPDTYPAYYARTKMLVPFIF